MAHRVATTALIAACLCALAGCAASSPAAPGQTRSPASATHGSAAPSGTQPGSTAPGSTAPGSTAERVAVDERDNHDVIRVGPGSLVTVVLHNTYWRFGPAPDPNVLAQLSAPRASPRPAHAGGCVPGQGCGTVTVVYRAVGPGSALIRASRTTCGEALRCTGSNGLFSVTIIVRR